ncbi:MAG: hypothetical protein ACJAZN_001073 [Planctomycetota bacterium]|jgi:hypothetical protein
MVHGGSGLHLSDQQYDATVMKIKRRTAGEQQRTAWYRSARQTTVHTVIGDGQLGFLLVAAVALIPYGLTQLESWVGVSLLVAALPIAWLSGHSVSVTELLFGGFLLVDWWGSGRELLAQAQKPVVPDVRETESLRFSAADQCH